MSSCRISNLSYEVNDMNREHDAPRIVAAGTISFCRGPEYVIHTWHAFFIELLIISEGNFGCSLGTERHV